MGKATGEELDALHGLVAELLSDKIRSGEATAADIAQAIKFLKDNNIESDLSNPGLEKLSKTHLPFPVKTAEEEDMAV